MPTFGNTTAETSTLGFETRIVGIRATLAEAGTLQTLHARLLDQAANTHEVRMAVYDTSQNLLGVTNARQDIANTAGWYSFTLVSPPALSAANYDLVVFAGGGSSNILLHMNGSTGSYYIYGGGFATYPTWPDPLSSAQWTTTSPGTPAIYGTYTVSGGGIATLANHHLRQLAG